MPLQATSGAASYDAFGGGVPVVPNYIEDVFNVWVYPGSNSATSINNGIDLSGKGGLVWTKGRTGSADNHLLIDTVRGVNKPLRSNETGGQYTETTLTAFNSNGYSITGGNGDINLLNRNYVSWTFREAPKFFDVVTWTGNNTYRNISHNLGSVPGCIIVKVTNGTSSWLVYHRSLGQSFGADNTLELNTTSASIAGGWGDYANPTATTFFVPPTAGLNANGETYVAYLFAHNAGGFGLTGTDNVISCGSYTGNGSENGPVVTLGYEPQWLLVKNASTTGNWFLMDNMRGIPMSGNTAILKANTSDPEDANQGHAIELNATGFKVTSSFTGTNGSGNTHIYIAIRRGPMKVPTTGTSVFSPNASTGTGSPRQITTNFPVDMGWSVNRASAATVVLDRLRGTGLDTSRALLTFDAGAEYTISAGFGQMYDNNTGITLQQGQNGSGVNYAYWNFRRAPGFFDEVCYTGTGSAQILNHNLGVFPQLVIVKSRSASANWPVVYAKDDALTDYALLGLNTTNASPFAAGGQAYGNNATTFVVTDAFGSRTASCASGVTYVAYLFASCPGVSKVGSYTGTGSTQTINCGFTGGARFVLIKATSTTGNWLVWDSARGIVSGNDPYLALNSTAAEVTNTDWVDTAASGFELSNAGGNLANSNGVSYVFLAVA